MKVPTVKFAAFVAGKRARVHPARLAKLGQRRL